MMSIFGEDNETERLRASYARLLRQRDALLAAAKHILVALADSRLVHDRDERELREAVALCEKENE